MSARLSSGRAARLAGAALLALLLTSCVGLEARARVAADGSGRLSLAYRVPRLLVALGALEQGERLLPFPVSREDFEGAVRGAEGLSLEAFSLRETEDDLVVEAELAFTSIGALAAFLDPKGARAAYAETGGERRLSLTLAPGLASLDPELERLAKAAFAPYTVTLAIRLPSAVKSAGIGRTSRDGVEASYSSPVADLATSRPPVVWEIRW